MNPHLVRKKTKFSRKWMEHFLHKYTTVPPSQLHLELAEDLSTFDDERGKRENRLAPRGSGKTTWATTGKTLHGALEGVEPYTLIFSNTVDQSRKFLRDIKAEIEDNDRILNHYQQSAGQGPIWNQDIIQLKNGCMIQCAGIGTSIRGIKKRADRPSLIIIDDPNEDDDVFSPITMERKLDWLRSAIMSLGSPATNIIVLGTPIHRQSVVYELYRGELSKTWNTKAYRSIIDWPERMDLWLEWENILAKISDPQRVRTARKFYLDHKDQMEAGAKVLWPGRESLYDLMLHRATIGHSAFNSEKQDQPGGNEVSEFEHSWFEREDFWFTDWPDGLLDVILAVDPSKGVTSKPGDYQAHATVGYHPSERVIYIDCQLYREPIPLMCERSLRIAKEFNASEIIVEENNTLGLIGGEYKQASRRINILKPIRTITHTDPKITRLRHPGGYLRQGRIRVRNTPGGRELVNQWRNVPNPGHDDGPDAVSTGIRRMEQLINARA